MKKQIKPLDSICPRCNSKNTTIELDVETVTFKEDGKPKNTIFFQSYIDCVKCGFSYILLKNLEDKTVPAKADSIQVIS